MAGPKSKTRNDVEFERVVARANLLRLIVISVAVLFCIIAVSVPLLVVDRMVGKVAGKETVVDVDIIVSIAISASLTVNGVQWVVGRSRKNEMLRERARANRLEAQLGLRQPE